MTEGPPHDATQEPEPEPERRARVWQVLQSLSWLALVSALLWFVLREFCPDLARISDRSVMPLIGVAGLVLGAMLVGAKLALAPPGRRPGFRDMLALFVAPAFALLMLAWALNHIGGTPEQTFVAPVTGLFKEKDGTRHVYRIQFMGPDGAVQQFTLASRVAKKDQAKWDNFAGFKRGGCALLSHRQGSLGLEIVGDIVPAPCPVRHGEAAPDGPVRVALATDDPKQWTWYWPEAMPAAGFEEWYQNLLTVARQHRSALSGQTIGLVARLEPDGRVSTAHLTGADVDPTIAQALAATLVTRSDVMLPPDTIHSSGEPMWVRVPLQLTIE